jgi:hypothetical protein
MSTGPLPVRPRYNTANMHLPIPGDTELADFVGHIGDLADAIDAVGSLEGPRGPTGPTGTAGAWWVGTQAQYNAIANPSPVTIYLIRGS